MNNRIPRRRRIIKKEGNAERIIEKMADKP